MLAPVIVAAVTVDAVLQSSIRRSVSRATSVSQFLSVSLSLSPQLDNSTVVQLTASLSLSLTHTHSQGKKVPGRQADRISKKRSIDSSFLPVQPSNMAGSSLQSLSLTSQSQRREQKREMVHQCLHEQCSVLLSLMMQTRDKRRCLHNTTRDVLDTLRVVLCIVSTGAVTIQGQKVAGHLVPK